ncbi:helix-turn-helix domain-containing protein [Streptomyces tubercidicus]|uniref:helix-turn-helix domain-containing protein n=1 Tax=Streptomyces tubercidicus TaxID=47759 RepID=UPI00367E62A0
MSDNQVTSRKAVLERGWYVVTGVETASLGLSGTAHDLLIIIKHLQGGNEDAFPRQSLLAQHLGCSVRTVQRTLDELVKKRALSCRRTGRASRYTVNYGHASIMELRILFGTEILIPPELVVSDTTHGVASDATDPDVPLPYKEPPTKNQTKNPSLREGGDVGAPQPDVQEDEMTWNRRPEPDDLDPVASMGLWSSQESPETGSESLGGLFAAEEVQTTSPRRQGRSQAQRDAPMALVAEFETALRATSWAGPAPVNRRALARHLSAWKADGLSADQIRGMMEQYVGDRRMRGNKASPPWQDFVWRRKQLLAALEHTAAVRAVENHRDDDPSYWLGTMAAGQ